MRDGGRLRGGARRAYTRSRVCPSCGVPNMNSKGACHDQPQIMGRLVRLVGPLWGVMALGHRCGYRGAPGCHRCAHARCRCGAFSGGCGRVTSVYRGRLRVCGGCCRARLPSLPGADRQPLHRLQAARAHSAPGVCGAPASGPRQALRGAVRAISSRSSRAISSARGVLRAHHLADRHRTRASQWPLSRSNLRCIPCSAPSRQSRSRWSVSCAGCRRQGIGSFRQELSRRARLARRLCRAPYRAVSPYGDQDLPVTDVPRTAIRPRGKSRSAL